LTYKLPEDYYGWAKDYLRTSANTVDDIINVLHEDEEFAESIAEENGINEEDETALDAALEELAPLMAKRLVDEFQEQQASWSAETDNVRLTRALKSLEPNIISFEGTFCCSSCGFYEIREDYAAFKYPQATGFVFYNEQTAQSASEGNGLWFSYGSLDGLNTQEDLKVATLLANALKAEGFEVNWDGTTEKTIQIEMLWQRAFPNLPA